MAIVESAGTSTRTQMSRRRPANAKRLVTRLRKLDTPSDELKFSERLAKGIDKETLDDFRTLMVTTQLVRLYSAVTAPGSR